MWKVPITCVQCMRQCLTNMVKNAPDEITLWLSSTQWHAIHHKQNTKKNTEMRQQWRCSNGGASHTWNSALFFKSEALLFVQEVQIIVPYFEILATLYHLSSWVKSLTGLHNEKHITEYLATSWMKWQIFKSLSLEIKLLDVT